VIEPELRDPWLVAVWPGMGAVAHIAGTYLQQLLHAQQVTEVDSSAWFDLRSVRVKKGVMQPAEMPRSVLRAWRNPRDGRDLVVMVADQQPATGGFRYCEQLLRHARSELRIQRVVTFAALGTPIHPKEHPRVFAVATGRPILAEAERARALPLEEGEIGGLNGVFLAAAAAQGVDGICLLGEFPFFANAIPNPKSSAAVLRTFARLSGVPLDLTDLDQQAAIVEKSFTEQLERLQRQIQEQQGGEIEFPTAYEKLEEQEEPVDPAVRARIEQLFIQAEKDRQRALDLKSELDRQGLFKDYEDRFLDLFKRAE
jgi:uncharacterized protein